MSDILEMLEEAEWSHPGAGGKGRPSEPSPYLPAVVKSWGERGEGEKYGKAYAFTINVGTGSAEEQDKALTKHRNLLTKAGRQVEGDPISVLVQTGDIARGGKNKGDVKVTFTTREKITRQARTAAAAEVVAEADAKTAAA